MVPEPFPAFVAVAHLSLVEPRMAHLYMLEVAPMESSGLPLLLSYAVTGFIL